MFMKVLLSIKPEYAYLILKGVKRFEFRKSIFKRKGIKTVVIYATMPVGKVIGEFDVGEVISLEPQKLWQLTKPYAGITKDFFDDYFGTKKLAFAISVENPKEYKNPLAIDDFLPGATPPQSYRYI